MRSPATPSGGPTIRSPQKTGNGWRRCRRARLTSTICIEICHGTPFDEDAYVFDDLDALRAMQASDRPVCLFGHTHVQVGYMLTGDQFTLSTMDVSRPLTISLADKEAQHLINPGSVGQPRDGDPRAGYALVDTDALEITIYRTEYPIADAQARIVAAGLPAVLAQRLALGR